MKVRILSAASRDLLHGKHLFHNRRQWSFGLHPGRAQKGGGFLLAEQEKVSRVPGMRKILLFMLVTLLFLPGCQTPEQKEQKERAAASIPDQTDDVSFQSFIGRLRQAVNNEDAFALAPMMTENFGYRLEPLGEGAGVFQYWDENNLWPELQLVVAETWKPLGNFMVTPPEFAANPTGYTGFRAGVVMVHGSWRFAYFVDG